MNQQAEISWRVKIGFLLFIVSIGWPILVPILPLVGVSTKVTATFSGVMIVAAELLLIAGAAVAGKAGFAIIKAKVFGFLKAYGPPQKVGRRRYTIGLVMFTVSLAFGWVSPYLGHYIPGFTSSQIAYAVVLDVLLLISLFVLGGDFWDKLRSLFRHDA